MEMDLKYLKLRRSLYDPSKGSINGKEMAVEDFYEKMAAECITPQIVLFDGNLLGFMRDFTKENWLNWLKMELDLVSSLEEAFGEKLDLIEKGKRKATSILVYTSERLNHIGKCIEVEENLEILRAVRAKKCYHEIKQIVKDFFIEKNNIISRESHAELLLSKLYVERLGTEASIFMLNTERSVIEIQKALCQDFSLEDDRGDANIAVLMDLLTEIVDNVEGCIGKIYSDSVVPDVDSRNYKIQLFTMCLERPQVAMSLEHEKDLLNKCPKFEHDLRNSFTEIREVWKQIQKKIVKSQDHCESLYKNRKDNDRNVSEINKKLNVYYDMHLRMMRILMKEEQLLEEMNILANALDIDPRILNGLNFIESKVADLKAKGELSFPPENYYGPVFRYLSFKPEIPESVIHKFMYVLKPLYSIIMVKTRSDATALLELAEDQLQRGTMELNILTQDNFYVREIPEEGLAKIEECFLIHEGLCDTNQRRVLKNYLLSNIVMSEVAEAIPGVTVVTNQGDFVLQGGAIGGGSYAKQVMDIAQDLRHYCSRGQLLEDYRNEKVALMVDIERSNIELDEYRERIQQRERMNFDYWTVRPVYTDLSELKMKIKTYLSCRIRFQKFSDNLQVVKDYQKLIDENALQPKSYYSEELQKLHNLPLTSDPNIADYLDFIRNLHSNTDHLHHLLKTFDDKYNWYDIGDKFKCSLTKVESDSEASFTAISDASNEKELQLAKKLDDIDTRIDLIQTKIRDIEKDKNILNNIMDYLPVTTDKCRDAVKKNRIAKDRIPVQYSNMSADEIDERISEQLSKYTELTGYSHFFKLNETVKMEYKSWRNKQRNLTRKLGTASNNVNNEVLFISDQALMVKQLNIFNDILKNLKFTREDGTSYHFSFMFLMTADRWFDCDNFQTKVIFSSSVFTKLLSITIRFLTL